MNCSIVKRRIPNLNIKGPIRRNWLISRIRIRSRNLIFPAPNPLVVKHHQRKRIFQVGFQINREPQVANLLEIVHQGKDRVLLTCAPSRLRFYHRVVWRKIIPMCSGKEKSLKPSIHRAVNSQCYSNKIKSSKRMERVGIRTFYVPYWHCWRNSMRVAWNWWSATSKRNWIKDTE